MKMKGKTRRKRKKNEKELRFMMSYINIKNKKKSSSEMYEKGKMAKGENEKHQEGKETFGSAFSSTENLFLSHL